MPRVSEPGASYSDRHLDPALARAYRDKFRGSLLRRLSHARERRIVRRTFAEACARLPGDLAGAGRPRLLDFPCGAGRFASHFAAAAAARGGTFVVADHSPAMLALCAQQLLRDGLAADRSVAADARAMPFADGEFDLACCIRLIHHFRDPADRARILREFRRVDRGPLVLTFLDADAPKQRRHQRRCERAGQPNRRAILTRAELAAEAAAAGWQLGGVRALSGRFSGQCVALLTPA